MLSSTTGHDSRCPLLPTGTRWKQAGRPCRSWACRDRPSPAPTARARPWLPAACNSVRSTASSTATDRHRCSASRVVGGSTDLRGHQDRSLATRNPNPAVVQGPPCRRRSPPLLESCLELKPGIVQIQRYVFPKRKIVPGFGQRLRAVVFERVVSQNRTKLALRAPHPQPSDARSPAGATGFSLCPCSCSRACTSCRCRRDRDGCGQFSWTDRASHASQPKRRVLRRCPENAFSGGWTCRSDGHPKGMRTALAEDPPRLFLYNPYQFIGNQSPSPNWCARDGNGDGNDNGVVAGRYLKHVRRANCRRTATPSGRPGTAARRVRGLRARWKNLPSARSRRPPTVWVDPGR